ncbi:MAG: lipopolysaccharide core heptose(I) kinase RfaP [Gammaproteobacteria bacterium]|jgi:heptose I phosphotransferase|nr:lipopolysaccharide core heptose(I) kinase RfaP [Gammaproteobacteria bacterium]
MLELTPEFAAQLPTDVPTFDYLMQLDGERFRDIANRRTLRFTLNGKRYFLKAHYGVGWKEIIKNLLQLRLPVLGARNEWQALQALTRLGVDTMKLVAYGERGWNPAHRQSFVVTEALEETESLEDFCAGWETHPPATKAGLRLKRALIERVATIARRMHANGINHRDFYICHFLLDVSADVYQQPPQALRLSLIDLHRVQLRKRTPLRWVVKDIGGLYFSSMRIGLTQRDLYRFMKVYRDTTLRTTLREDGKFWSRCRLRAFSLYHSFYHELPATP